ncbi:hypothetical protein Rleg2_1131 [Rhizobium leguminosarum bv. trifolii WSM2304]|uniref:HNH endonuclease n=1 Tax=Rhizobium leguminosarum bv. trifolii (strain WSM2304) TaxID=395492 RepID=A0ABF7QK63_RHILW|nr:hypothetical protein [Rhizobium leguminosarum]ACI54425.1 hypothetical protein Rleg2_1131 [Rhizobium leguminosarum bv. trifolii WSM2304]
MEKTCFKCERVKPLTEFYRHKQMADGHLNKCKECTKADVLSNYHKNPERVKAYESRRAMLEHRVEARRQYARRNPDVISRINRASTKRHPDRRSARVKLGNAVRDGLPKAAACEVCNRPGRRIHGHHEDYSRPVWVAWVCTTCHRNIHKGIVTLGRFHHER